MDVLASPCVRGSYERANVPVRFADIVFSEAVEGISVASARYSTTSTDKTVDISVRKARDNQAMCVTSRDWSIAASLRTVGLVVVVTVRNARVLRSGVHCTRNRTLVILKSV